MHINIVDSTIEDTSRNLNFARISKEKGEAYEWLYHCTNMDGFINIVKSREFWLSNLRLVNDKEEGKREIR